MTESAPESTQGRRRRPPWWLWVLLGLGATVGIIAAVGGFDEVPLEELPTIELGDVHHGTQLDTVVTSVYLSTRVPGQDYDTEEGTVLIVVETTLLNTTDYPVYGLDAVRAFVDGAIEPEVQPYGLYELRRGDQVGRLQPGLPVDSAFVWEVDASSVSVGDEIRLGVLETFASDNNPIFDDARTAPIPTALIVTTIGERP